MKSVRFAYSVFLILVIAVLLNSLAIGRMIDLISEELSAAEETDMTIAKEEYAVIYDKYKKYELYISLTVNHDDLSNIEDSFSEIVGSAKAEDEAGVLTAKNRLTEQLSHVKRLAGVNVDSIF